MAPSASDPRHATANPAAAPSSYAAAAATAAPGSATEYAMMRGLAHRWWLFLLRGVVAIAFGVIALTTPALGLIGLLAFIAAWMLLDGIFTIGQAIAGPPERHGIWYWLSGIVSLLAAAVIFFAPGLSAVVLVLVAGAWWAVNGVFEIVAGVRQRSWMLGLAGVAALALGVLVLLRPGPGLLAMVWLAGIVALLSGGLMIALAFRLRRVVKDMEARQGYAEGQATAAADPSIAGKAPFAPATTSAAIAPTGVPAVDTDEPPPRPANDPGERGRGAA